MTSIALADSPANVIRAYAQDIFYGVGGVPEGYRETVKTFLLETAEKLGTLETVSTNDTTSKMIRTVNDFRTEISLRPYFGSQGVVILELGKIIDYLTAR